MNDASSNNMDRNDKSNSKTQLQYWDPENEEFWESEGKVIAKTNLLISIPNLLLGFAIWIIWSVLVVKIQTVHDGNPEIFAFPEWGGGLTGLKYQSLLYTLPAIAGLSGATLRIPNSFMISISGGRNVIGSTTLLLLLPMVVLGIVLQNPDVPFVVLVIIAIFSGVGGGAFASSMSNISFFYPKRMQGLALGLNAGLGNVGVSIMQLSVPIVTTFAIFGSLSGKAQGGIYIQNAALIWVPLAAIFMVAAFLKMHNLPNHDVSHTKSALIKYYWLEFLGFIAAGVGVTLQLISWGTLFESPFFNFIRIFVTISIVVATCLFLMSRLTPLEIKKDLDKQFEIFDKKHNWIMTWLYVMTFGSFIGFSSAFPKLILDSFGYLPDNSVNPNGPNPLIFAWLGPLVGSLVRPIGGWMSDKWRGGRVTHWNTVVMILSTIGVGITLQSAKSSFNPETYFPVFLALFLILFITTGIGNGSTFQMVPMIFEKDQAGPVLGWISAIAAYGSFIIPVIFSITILLDSAEMAMFGFAIYYLTALFLNWYYYARKNAEIPC